MGHWRLRITFDDVLKQSGFYPNSTKTVLSCIYCFSCTCEVSDSCVAFHLSCGWVFTPQGLRSFTYSLAMMFCALVFMSTERVFTPFYPTCSMAEFSSTHPLPPFSLFLLWNRYRHFLTWPLGLGCFSESGGFSSPPHLWPKRLHASFTN